MDLQELSQWMKERNLKGHWEHSEWSQSVKPYLWKGEEIMQALNWSGELITTGEAGRRTIQMRNPGLSAGMTNTVHISVQLVKPGEVAAAHRHTAAAIQPCFSSTRHGTSYFFGPMRLKTSPSCPSSRTSVAVSPSRRRAWISAVARKTGAGSRWTSS